MRHLRGRNEGFTFIELLVVLAIMMIIALIGLPWLLGAMARAKHESAVRNAASLGRAARLNAIKFERNVYLFADPATNTMAIYSEAANPPNGFDPATPGADTLIATAPLPDPLSFSAPAGGGSAFEGLEVDNGLYWAEFLPSGAVTETGAFRIADAAAAEADNFLEIRINPAATARVSVRKWNGAVWREQGEAGESWSWY